MNNNFEQVGELSEAVITVLGLNLTAGMKIFIGQSNIEHMKKDHFREFNQYFSYLPTIIASPDFVGINQKDGSIEYIKDLSVVPNGNSIKVAVRISGDGLLFARTIYEIFGTTVANRIKDGTLKRLTKP